MCVVKGPARKAMARTKEVKPDGTVHILPPKKKRPKAQAKEDQHPRGPHYELAYDKPLRPLNEETPPLRASEEETPSSRTSEEETTRLSSSSDEAVLDASLSAPSHSALRERRVETKHTVISKGKETTTVMTLFRKEEKDEHEVETNYEGDTSEEEIVPETPSSSAKEISRIKSKQINQTGSWSIQKALEQNAAPKGGKEHQALGVVSTTALSQEMTPCHDNEKAEGEGNLSDSALSIEIDLITNGQQDIGSPEAVKAKPVLNAKDIMSIVERKDISIKTPVHNHNPQRQGLEDNLFDFGDALCDYTSDGGTIRINQGLATLMLIAATAEAPNRLLMESKREAFEQVTAQAKDMLEKQRNDYEKQCEAIERRHQELASQHYEHLENMRKQNELLQEEVMKARGLYSKAFQQFEVASPDGTLDGARALKMQTALALSLKSKAERHKDDYEREKAKRLQKEQDLEEAEKRITKLKEELAFLEDNFSFDVVPKRPLARSELDSPDVHAEKKVKVEEVPDIKSVMVQEIKSKENVESVGKVADEQAKSPKAKVDAEDSLVLNSDGDIEGAEIVDQAALTRARIDQHKDFFSTKQSADKSDIHGFSRREKEIPLKTLLGESGLNCSDDELVKQSLIAWRHHLRCQNIYKPDKLLARQTHEAHVKILMSALTSFKRERQQGQFTHKAKLFFKHEGYSMMYKSYNVPANSCTPYELMSKVDKDRSILLRLRCAPLNDFYSMLMEDTPGYIPSAHWSKPPIKESPSARSRSGSKSPIKEWSKSPDHESTIRSEDGSSTVKKAMSRSAKESSSAKEDVVWGTTDHLSARRTKNLQRGPRENPIAGEEKGYSSESGNADEDHDNSFYDPRLVPSDKTLLADWMHRIRKVKRREFPKLYEDTRDEWLKNAEIERIKSGFIPACMHDVEPPYDKGHGLALLRYDEMYISNLDNKISQLRERNAASCAKYDAAKKHGPRDGQGRR